MRRVSAIGLMSGTSLDGIDAALINTDGSEIGRLGPSFYRPYGEAERALLRRALKEAAAIEDRAARPGVLNEAEALATRPHAEPAQAILRPTAVKPAAAER